MEPQFFVNILIAIAGFGGGWIINSISKSVTRLEDKIADFPHIYVGKEDYRSDIQDIKSMLGKIFDRLENKADK